jgi:four helix bundle protein
MDLAEQVYAVTRAFPKEELYGLVSQLRRCAVSVPSNIAEGQGRMSKGEFRHFLGLARGSLLELETQILLSTRLSFVSERQTAEILGLSNEVRRMLHGLAESLMERDR